jgi:hypothetical protein
MNIKNQKKSIWAVIAAFVCLLITSGCGPSKEEIASMDSCIAPLMKIAASTKAGLDLKDLEKLTIEAKAVYDTNSRKIKNNDFRIRIQKALEAYEDSLKGWKAIKHSGLTGIISGFRGNLYDTGQYALVDKYKLKWGNSLNSTPEPESWISQKEFLSSIWQVAADEANAAADIAAR